MLVFYIDMVVIVFALSWPKLTTGYYNERLLHTMELLRVLPTSVFLFQYTYYMYFVPNIYIPPESPPQRTKKKKRRFGE